ncbi:MAG: hypothetical protein AAGA42_11290, partial [Actinomycetota bacterium]
LVELSADFAAFKNVSPEQALQDIQAGFAGSTEVLRKYNIFLDDATLKQAYFRETGEEVTGTLTAQQRIIATQSELYRQGADMIGQWNRESGELAGQQAQMTANLQNLGDTIGAGVLPHLTTFTSMLNDAAGGLASIDGATGGALGNFATIGVAVTALAGGLSFAIGKVIQFREQLKLLGRYGKIGAAGIGIASAALLVYMERAEEAARQQEHLTEKVEEFNRSTDSDLPERFFWALSDLAVAPFGDEVQQVKLGVDDLTESISNFVQETPGGAQRLLEMEEASGGVSAGLTEMGVPVEYVTQIIELLTDAVQRETAAQRELTKTTEAAAKVTGDAAEEASELASALDEVATPAEVAEQVLSDLEVKLSDIRDRHEEVTQRLADQEDEIQAWAESINENARSAAAGFTSFNEETLSSLDSYLAELSSSTEAMSAWQTNLTTIAGRGGQEVANELAKLGPDGAQVVADFAQLTGADFDAAVQTLVAHTVTANRDMQAEWDKVAPGVEEKLAAAREAANAEILLLRDEMREASREAGQALTDGYDEHASALETVAGEAAAGAVAAVAGLVGESWSAGHSVGVASGQGFESGIRAEAESMSSAAVEAVRGALEAVRAELGISSPSRVFDVEVGQPIPQGVAQGIETEADKIGETLTDAIEDAGDEARDAAQDVVDDVRSEFNDITGRISSDRRLAQQRRDVAEAEAELRNASPEDRARAQQRLSDRRFRLFESLADRAIATGDASLESEIFYTGQRAGVSQSQLRQVSLALMRSRDARAQQALVEAGVAAWQADARGQVAGIAAGGGSISVTVNAGFGTDGALVGKQVIEVIKAYERRNGPGWRS